jgi:hypothetical protein
MKKLLATTVPAITFLTVATSAFADSFTLCPTSGSGFTGLCSKTIGGMISPLITLIFLVAIIVAVIYLLWGGIKWIMSGGDKSALQSAREHVIAAIIGLVIVFLVYFLVNYIFSAFGLTGTSAGTFQLPTF